MNFLDELEKSNHSKSKSSSLKQSLSLPLNTNKLTQLLRTTSGPELNTINQVSIVHKYVYNLLFFCYTNTPKKIYSKRPTKL